ncbi:MAG: PepSY domain-containing protein [Verrucomicrobia bacterium]|nr:PepSY domain-containing protein [Verrucomicrobiota bacterium]
MNPAPRKFHRRIAPWLALPLAVTLATGIAYRTGRAWFGMGKETGGTILDIHAGAWLGDTGSVIYVILMGAGLLALVATGFYLVLKSRAKGQPRVFHRILGAILLLPLAASAVTGIAFKVGEEWLDLPKSTLDLLLNIHQGGWLGTAARPFYVLAVGIGLLVLALTGLQMTGLFRKKKP